MKKVMYLCNDRIFETYEDAAIDCAERGIWGSSSKDHIEELPYIGRTCAEGAKEKAREILEGVKNLWGTARFRDSAERDKFYAGLEDLGYNGMDTKSQPQETEPSISNSSDNETQPDLSILGETQKETEGKK